MTALISVHRAAQLLDCSRSSILRYIESGELAGVQLTKHGWWKVSRESVQRKLTKLAELTNPNQDFER
jgi:excisionase family DNA binding protein